MIIKAVYIGTLLEGFLPLARSVDQGPVVQSILSLTSSLRGQLIKCFITLLPNTMIFFVEKIGEAFASHIFSTKNIAYIRD